MKHFLTGIGVALALGMPVNTQALEPFVLYDNFNTGPMDPDRWGLLTDFSRTVQGKRLRMSARAFGTIDSDSGTSSNGVNSPLSGVAASIVVQSLRADVIVNSMDLSGCVGNSSPSQVRARLISSLFNVGTPVPGSQAGDVSAQIFLRRLSDSVDAINVLRVGGSVDQCIDNACASSTRLGQVDLGTATLGQLVKLQMQWDAANNQVLFKRDADAAVSVPYASSDTALPGAPLRNLSIRLTVPNCTGQFRPSAAIDGTFDNVYVNQSAVPP